MEQILEKIYCTTNYKIMTPIKLSDKYGIEIKASLYHPSSPGYFLSLKDSVVGSVLDSVGHKMKGHKWIAESCCIDSLTSAFSCLKLAFFDKCIHRDHINEY